MFDLTKEEEAVLKRLSTPDRIYDFLDSLPINWEKKGETIMSPRRVLRERKAHCIEGALLAAFALWYHGDEPLLMDMKALPVDSEHVITVYKKNGYWGSLSKTNHGTIRGRDPIYKTPRELVMSYYHEYFINETGKKTLTTYSLPFNMKKLGTDWITAEEDLDYVSDALDALPHFPFVPKENRRYVRLAHRTERDAGRVIEWEKSDPRT